MQARYYDPVIGRFYSNDPIGFRDIHSFNRYAYANNNPYKYIDPTGMSSEKGACPNFYACLDSSESSSIQDTGGWQKTGVTDNGIDRYSFVKSSKATNNLNNINTTVGYGTSIAAATVVNSNGVWLGKNGKYYGPSVNGNGTTGGRLKFAERLSDGMLRAGKLSFYGGAAISVYNYNEGNVTGFKATVDLAMGAVGLIWPFGTAASAAYFLTDLSNDGDWSSKPIKAY